MEWNIRLVNKATNIVSEILISLLIGKVQYNIAFHVLLCS